MEPVAALLAEARAAGLSLEVDGATLIVRGPKSAEPIVRRLGHHKPQIIALLSSEPRERAEAFRHQLEAWVASGRWGVPVLALPGITTEPGACVSCASPLPPGSTWRCPICVTAVRLALGLDPHEEGAR